MSPFAYTSSNPKQEASYNAKARGHARGQSDALTYGGKCVAQRGTQFANHAQEISGAVTVFFFPSIWTIYSSFHNRMATANSSDSTGCAQPGEQRDSAVEE